jgi:hypothetical protein
MHEILQPTRDPLERLYAVSPDGPDLDVRFRPQNLEGRHSTYGQRRTLQH